ncbi:MAG TPA: hypothetical protein VFE62_21040 [Gemmataceae bacterium]|nr:hypothetical protein [Gemmataceae bacterium]
MSKKLNTNAVYHGAIGALESKLGKEGVDVGLHDLSRARLVLDFPQGVLVNRPEGDLGEGFDANKAPKKVPLEAALLKAVNPQMSWLDCLRTASAVKAEDLMPAEAIEALAILEVEALAACPKAPFGKRKTSARRVNADKVRIQVERLTIAEYQALSTSG